MLTLQRPSLLSSASNAGLRTGCRVPRTCLAGLQGWITEREREKRERERKEREREREREREMRRLSNRLEDDVCARDCLAASPGFDVLPLSHSTCTSIYACQLAHAPGHATGGLQALSPTRALCHKCRGWSERDDTHQSKSWDTSLDFVEFCSYMACQT